MLLKTELLNGKRDLKKLLRMYVRDRDKDMRVSESWKERVRRPHVCLIRFLHSENTQNV